MLTRRTVRLTPLAAFALVLACDGKRRDSETTIVSDQQSDSSARADASVDTLVVQMTGALVLVPASSGGMNVMLPNDREGMPHVARLGFGIEENNPKKYPCVDDSVFSEAPTKEGICYIDLVEWEVLDLGASGAPSPAVQTLPGGVLNVSRLSRGHKASHPKEDARATLHLATGEAGGSAADQCSLARWTYQLPQEQGAPKDTTSELINVLNWRITDPDRQFRLRSRKDTMVIHTVDLQMPKQRKIELILAHVPMKELGHLPPAPAATLEDPPLQADHVDLYYDLLRHPGTGERPAGADRRLPRKPEPLRNKACPVDITTWVVRAVQRPPSVATYACMVGTGEG